MQNPITQIIMMRYRWYTVPFAFISMALFHLPFRLNKNILFYKLMGSGRNGTFDKTPDFMQWCILLTLPEAHFNSLPQNHNNFLKQLLGGFIYNWLKLFTKEQLVLSLATLKTHGQWDEKEPFGQTLKNHSYDGPICVMTRATIRLNRFSNFWKHVDGVAKTLNAYPDFITSFGVGEIPWIKQATFSVWKSETAMMDFAYKQREHAQVVQKTKKENWYSEDLFCRFIPLRSSGTLKGKNLVKDVLGV
jgi:hypothetical protein